ncbi:carbohydrate ABC transporter permease [Ancrocorticia populi]|uniref:carbohydrate ABC transporter permease n=1 Tax=Ancrocorticia populi TaxID=2175228 RepID=UPI003F93CF8F
MVTMQRRRKKSEDVDSNDRGILSAHDRQKFGIRLTSGGIGTFLFIALIIVSIGPILFMFKAGTSTAQDTIREPFGLWPSGFTWEFFGDAFSRVNFGTYLLNTLWVCLGSWVVAIVVATTAGYLLAILRPRYAIVLEVLVMVTMLIPSVVSMVALYSMIVDVPILHVNLINTFWSVWFPLGVSSFSVLLVTNSFKTIPRDLYDAARLDGASNLKILLSIVLPMQKPILGVVSLLSLVSAYKEFLWPMLTLRDSSMQPLSVALPQLEGTTALPTYMAALFMALLIPVLIFFVFHKQFLSSAGAQGAIKE